METFLYKLLIYALSIPKQICNVILKVYDLNNTTGNGIQIFLTAILGINTCFDLEARWGGITMN
jgi:hypothetical protein